MVIEKVREKYCKIGKLVVIMVLDDGSPSLDVKVGIPDSGDPGVRLWQTFVSVMHERRENQHVREAALVTDAVRDPSKDKCRLGRQPPGGICPVAA